MTYQADEEAAIVDGLSPMARLLRKLPPKEPEPQSDMDEQINHSANLAAEKRAEARRDATLAVALAIKRRGDDPLTGWTTKDISTAYAMAEQLIALER